MENFTIGIIIAIIIGLIAAYMMFAPAQKPVSSQVLVLPSQQPTVSAPVIAKPFSPLDQFTMTREMDRAGADIGCFDGKDADFCATKCLADTTCKSIIHSPSGTGSWHGCCYKTSISPLTANKNVNFYARN